MNRIFLLITYLALSCGAAIAHPPTGIVVDKDGNTYFTDLETVWKLDNKGALQVVRPGVSGRHVHELTIDNAGDVYGADVSYEAGNLVSSVWKISSNGQFSYVLAPTSDPPRGMGIWIDRTGNMYSVEQDNRTKTQTLILRRDPKGVVTTLAGGQYGQLDGKGTAARFSSIGGMAFGPDGALYLTDGNSLRRVTMDGEVTTVVKDLTARTADDRPMLFGKNDGIVTGLSIDKKGNVYVADAGNQRLLKIDPSHNVEVVYRGEGEYYANGVYATQAGDLYILEVGFRPPGTWLKPRVKKIVAAGQKSDVVVAATENGPTKNELEVSSARPLRRAFAIVMTGLLVIGLVLIGWREVIRRERISAR